MTRGIFIAGNDCALSRAIEAETVKRVEQYASAVIPNRISGTVKNQSQETGRLPLEWNPSSPISARTLAIAAENRLERIDEAILICTPPSIRNSAADLSISDVDMMINDQIKGWFFLIKELATLFRIRKNGTLALVYPDISGSGKDDTVDIIGPSVLASFRAFVNGLLATAANEPYITMGFYTTDAGNEAAFAAYIFKSLEDIKKSSNGKLHKFGKFHFFK